MTEQEIRGLSISFLKNHYKFRPHKVWNGIEVRNERHDFGGIIIDASLSYKQQDGTDFTATVEASSLDRGNEVYYRYHWFRLLFESITLALVVIAIVYGLLSHVWSDWLVSVGQPGGLQSGLHLFTASWMFFSLLLALVFPKRYRYIYAVEQFKLFHADDQWIAYDAELFHTHEDKHYLELERQCMHYGFGLLQIERDRRVRIMVSPKRGDYFGQKRKKLPIWAEQLSSAPVLGKAVEKRFGGVSDVDESIKLQDPLAEMQFELPGSAPLPEVSNPAPSKSSGKRQLPKWLPFPKRKSTAKTTTGATMANEVAKPSFQDRIQLLLKKLQPEFAKELPGYFIPPARWSTLFLLAILCNVGLLAWRAGLEEVVPKKTEREALELERKFDKRILGSPTQEADLNSINLNEENYIPSGQNTDLDPVIDEDRMDRLAPKVGSDVMFYNLNTQGDTLVRDRCPRFTNSGQRIYAMIYGRYNDLDAALEDAFRLHADINKEISVTQGECVNQDATPFMVMIGKPSADEGEINLRFRELRRDAGLKLEILPFE